MGMFDYIKCEADLPETPLPPPHDNYGLFQTKDTPDQYLTVYTITDDGRLTVRPYFMEEVPPEQRPYPNDTGILGLIGCLRRVEAEPESVKFHGDIEFYKSSPGGGWWEYKARFTEGLLTRIELVEFIAPEMKDQRRPLTGEAT